jgi:rhodanese-related sulfurtransferase
VVTAIEVARWIRAGRSDVRLVDVRGDSLFEAYHIPGAERIASDGLSRRTWHPDESVVVYGEDDGAAVHAAAIIRQHGAERVYVLPDGLLSWIDQIVEPRLTALAPTATSHERATRREHLELSRYFGGTPFVSPAPSPRENGKIRASEAAAVARIMRRGC